jgi:hypothetical protein
MKIDLIYPKIPENSDKFHGKCIAFEKYDGTNLHWTWNANDGWRFGTRRTQFLLNKSGIGDFVKEHSELSNAPHLFNDHLRDKLTIFCNTYHYWNREFTFFTEFYGPNSFAGGHSSEDAHDETQELIMIDVAIDKKILPPEEFINRFQGYTIARVVFTGKYSGQFAEDVSKGKYDVNEGVVVKGIVDGQVFMTKVKTKDYLKRLEKR